jgi:hypothetical protein
MSITLLNRVIDTVRLIDDEPIVRTSYRQPVDDLNLNAIEVVNRIGSLAEFERLFNFDRDAAICDFNLKRRSYSAFDGDVLVSHLYKKNVPAVLCTRYADDLPEAIRHRRRHIPIVIPPEELSEEALIHAFKTCIAEFRNQYSRDRKPWRTLIRIEGCEPTGADQLRLSLFIPGWNSSEGLTFTVPTSPRTADQKAIEHIQKELQNGEVARVYAQVNLGAERKQDIYIYDWAVK